MKKPLTVGLCAGVVLAGTSIVLAWSSKSFLPCEPIHQMAIEIVLSNLLPFFAVDSACDLSMWQHGHIGTVEGRGSGVEVAGTGNIRGAGSPTG